MPKTRKSHPPSLKAKVAVEAIKAHKTAAQIAEGKLRRARIDERKVDAQQARRILDRLVGYKASPILWRTIKTGLSAGRVQTVALRLIVERERERREEARADWPADWKKLKKRARKVDT